MKKENYIKVLKERTINMFSEDWYNDTSNALMNISFETYGYVYFIKNNSSVDIKIGVSYNINDRMKSYRTAFSGEIFLIGYIYCENYKELEKEIHNLYKDKRISGEWFNVSVNDVRDVLIKYNGKFINSEFSKKSFIDKYYYSNFNNTKYSMDFSILKIGERITHRELYKYCDNVSVTILIKELKSYCLNKNITILRGNTNGDRWIELK